MKQTEIKNKEQINQAVQEERAYWEMRVQAIKDAEKYLAEQKAKQQEELVRTLTAAGFGALLISIGVLLSIVI